MINQPNSLNTNAVAIINQSLMDKNVNDSESHRSEYACVVHEMSFAFFFGFYIRNSNMFTKPKRGSPNKNRLGFEKWTPPPIGQPSWYPMVSITRFMKAKRLWVLNTPTKMVGYMGSRGGWWRRWGGGCHSTGTGSWWRNWGDCEKAPKSVWTDLRSDWLDHWRTISSTHAFECSRHIADSVWNRLSLNRLVLYTRKHPTAAESAPLR